MATTAQGRRLQRLTIAIIARAIGSGAIGFAKVFGSGSVRLSMSYFAMRGTFLGCGILGAGSGAGGAARLRMRPGKYGGAPKMAFLRPPKGAQACRTGGQALPLS